MLYKIYNVTIYDNRLMQLFGITISSHGAEGGGIAAYRKYANRDDWEISEIYYAEEANKLPRFLTDKQIMVIKITKSISHLIE